mmetsp:Transcript_28722/g.70334  ORF Transcript_28722/g.70334 Transcript_28722/m.70334 type:complete len:224 (+) Transcript_28722:367-1038(+)
MAIQALHPAQDQADNTVEASAVPRARHHQTDQRPWREQQTVRQQAHRQGIGRVGSGQGFGQEGVAQDPPLCPEHSLRLELSRVSLAAGVALLAAGVAGVTFGAGQLDEEIDEELHGGVGRRGGRGRRDHPALQRDPSSLQVRQDAPLGSQRAAGPRSLVAERSLRGGGRGGYVCAAVRQHEDRGRHARVSQVCDQVGPGKLYRVGGAGGRAGEPPAADCGLSV